ncbi:MAG: extracellular solute-binding protein [Lachnospiraceae bacterium]|nr:extracellular solute-binding protein [Lachnospiraceae bacterium]
MKVSGKRLRRILAIFLCVFLVGDTFHPAESARAENTQSVGEVLTEQNKNTTSYDRIAYYYYIRQYSDAAKPYKEIEVNLEPIEEYTDAECVSVYTNLEGSETGLQFGRTKGQATFRVKVPKSGLYNISLKYLALAESNVPLTVGVLIDQELPFTEASTCPLSRTFRNGEIRQDEFGNDIRPIATQQQVWRTQYLSDQTGVNGELYFYLAEGEHLISLVSDGIPFLLEGMTIGQQPYVMSYQDYLSLHTQKGYTNTEGIVRIVQAEQFSAQSSSVLWPVQDKTSPLTEPFDYSVIKLNTAGGSQWKSPGQWISWEVDVPEDGFYQIGIKYRQSYLEGLYSSRRLLIDGQVPFAELGSIRFDYDSQWQMNVLGNEYDEPYSIYLTAGTHTLTLENVVGDLSSTLDVLQTVITNLNELYLSVIMVTSSNPDPYRDYYVAKNFPNLADQLTENANLLFAEANRLIETVGERGSEAAFMEDIAYDLVNYAENVENLTYKGRIEDLKTNITSLSTKVSELGEQALDIDYLIIASQDVKMPRVTPNLWEWLKYQVGSFIASWKEQEKVNDTEESESTGETVRVWLSGGNDQYQILKDMINDMFTPATGIEVDLELVSGTLIEAVVSGQGPDVAIGVDADTVVNLALRGALTDLAGFQGFEELKAEHIEGSFIPFTLEGRVYGIANVNAFNMMFVRTDIFKELGLEIPDTWDEMYDVTQVLQRNNMSLGTVPGFATLLYQKGGSYFDEGLTKVVFDEEVAVEAFTQYTEFYTKYSYEVTYDFLSRFRSGEMPIAIQPYSMYNTLKYSAPEINGLWEMFKIPGTVREDGTVDYTQADSGGTGTVLLGSNGNEEAAWEFIRWWSGAEAQTRYGKDLEAIMGTAARYATANLETFQELDWSLNEKEVLLEQIAHMEYIPIVPGNYYISRGINNTFRAVVYDGENVREYLLYWTEKVNKEITRKREEFYQNN